MELARDHFLAHAAFAAQQDAHVAVGDALDHRDDRLHRWAGAPARLCALGILGHLRAQPRQFRAQRLALQRVADRGLERRFADALGIVGLQHVVGRAEPHGFDDGRGRLAPGQHDDARRGVGVPDGPQRLEAVEIRHQHVEQDHVRRRAGAQALEQRAAAVEHLYGVAAGAEQRLEVAGERGIVIDKSKLRGH